jgi:hypothetical protein
MPNESGYWQRSRGTRAGKLPLRTSSGSAAPRSGASCMPIASGDRSSHFVLRVLLTREVARFAPPCQRIARTEYRVPCIPLGSRLRHLPERQLPREGRRPRSQGLGPLECGLSAQTRPHPRAIELTPPTTSIPLDTIMMLRCTWIASWALDIVSLLLGATTGLQRGLQCLHSRVRAAARRRHFVNR